MRRFTAVFTTKRSDRPDGVSSSHPHHTGQHARKKTQVSNSLESSPTISSAPPTPQLTKSSASTSSGSTDLRTPDDDALSSGTFLSRASWIPWMGRKKSGNSLRPPRQEQERSPTSTFQPRAPPLLRPAPARRPRISDDETTSEESSSDSGSHPTSRDAAHNPAKPVTPARCREYARMITSNKLVTPQTAPPLLHLPGTHLYPRSCNMSRHSHFQETLESTMQRRRLLKRLNGPLTHADEMLLRSFGSRSTPLQRVSQPHSNIDIVVPDVKRMSSHSHGLKRWASRRPFEERMLCWTPADEGLEGLNVTHIKGTAFGVPEIEYSESLEVLAGIYTEFDRGLERLPDPEPPMPLPINETLVAVPGDTRKAPFKALPSPLRMQYGPVSPQVSPTSSGGITDRPLIPAPEPDPPTGPKIVIDSDAEPPSTKRGVRFAEGDKDDSIPLGYVLRMKKRREAKAKFLQEESERRAFEEERRKIEAERTQREAERSEWERERKAWEKEKRTMEEERKRRFYAGEFAAARLRQKNQREGYGVPSSSSFSSAEHDTTHHPDPRRQHRPVHDHLSSSRRQASDSSGGPSPNAGSSAGSSRPPSVKAPPAPSLQNMRSPAMFSSADDLRLHELGMYGNTRNSLAPASDRASFYSTWSGHMPPVPAMPVPAMPVIPMYLTEVPLLPPTPPFVLQQYPRPKNPTNASSSRRSSTASNTMGSDRGDQRDQRSAQFDSPLLLPQPSHSRSSHRHSLALQDQYRRNSGGDESLSRKPQRGANVPPRSSWQPSASAHPSNGRRPQESPLPSSHMRAAPSRSVSTPVATMKSSNRRPAAPS